MPINDNHSIDYNLLQSLHNGFTFVCILNESDMFQSNYLLNIRLEPDNSTLFWSRPAWDIANTWTHTFNTVNVDSSSSADASAANEAAKNNANGGGGNAAGANSGSGGGAHPQGGNFNRRESQFKSSLLNSSLLMTFDPSNARFPSKSENYLKKKLFSGAGNSNMKKSLAATSVRRKLTLPVNIYKPPVKLNGAVGGNEFVSQKTTKFSGNFNLNY